MYKKLYDKATKLLRELRQVEAYTECIRDDCLNTDIEKYKNDIDDCVYMMEKVAVRYRDLPSMLGLENTHEWMRDIYKRAWNIKIEITPEGWIRVNLPNVRPQSHKSPDSLRIPLFEALEEFFVDLFKQNKREFRIEKGIIIFKFYYPNDIPEKLCSDIDNLDNYEISAIVNDIAFFTLPDDGPFRCARCFFADRAENTHCEVFVIPDIDLEKWSAKHKPNDAINSQIQ
jgi:hypothetical protein